MKKLIEDCILLTNEDNKKKNEKNEASHSRIDTQKEKKEEKVGFVIKKNNNDIRDPLLRKK